MVAPERHLGSSEIHALLKQQRCATLKLLTWQQISLFRQHNSSLHAYLSIASAHWALHQLALGLRHLRALQKEPIDAARTMDTSQAFKRSQDGRGIQTASRHCQHPDTLRMTDSWSDNSLTQRKIKSSWIFIMHKVITKSKDRITCSLPVWEYCLGPCIWHHLLHPSLVFQEEIKNWSSENSLSLD